MTVLLLEGFNGVANADIPNRYLYNDDAPGYPNTIQTTNPRYGPNHIFKQLTYSDSMYIAPEQVSWPLCIEFGAKLDKVLGGTFFDLLGYNGSGPGTPMGYFGGLGFTTTRQIEIVRKTGSNSFPAVATSEKAMLHGSWYRFKCIWDLDGFENGDNGSIEVYLDDQLWVSYSGAFVYNAMHGDIGLEQYESLWFNFGASEYGATSLFYLSDISVTAATDGTAHELGDVCIETVKVDDDGSSTDWTPLSSTNASNVDETTPDGDTTYNSSSTIGDLDLYTVTPLSASVGDVKAVLLNVVSRTPETCNNIIIPALKSGGTLAYGGSGEPVNTEYVHRRADFTDSFSWTIAKVNAMEIGAER